MSKEKQLSTGQDIIDFIKENNLQETPWLHAVDNDRGRSFSLRSIDASFDGGIVFFIEEDEE